jgi:small subunit ribosomal protein S17
MAKTLTGVVTSDVADKTITVTVTSRETHPIYGKQYSVNRKYAAHDENNTAKKGDKVTISSIRPVSKRKSFKLDTIIEKSHGSIQLKDEPIIAIPPKLHTEVLADKEVHSPKLSKKASTSKLSKKVLEAKS